MNPDIADRGEVGDGFVGHCVELVAITPRAYAWDATNAVIRIPGETNRMRVLRLRFLPR